MAAPKGNKNALGNTGGRPALFDTATVLQSRIDSYFKIKREKKTICGLAYYLGFESRQSFYDYEENVEFSYTIKRARLRIEMVYEKNLQTGNATGSIFALKNMKWSDKQEIDHNVNIQQLPDIIIKAKID